MVEHGLKAGRARSFYRKLTQPYLFLFFNFPKHTVNSGRYGGHDQGSPTSLNSKRSSNALRLDSTRLVTWNFAALSVEGAKHGR